MSKKKQFEITQRMEESASRVNENRNIKNLVEVDEWCEPRVIQKFWIRDNKESSRVGPRDVDSVMLYFDRSRRHDVF